MNRALPFFNGESLEFTLLLSCCPFKLKLVLGYPWWRFSKIV